MNGKVPLFLLLIIAALPVQVQAQQVILSSQELEDLLYRDESAIIPEAFPGDYPESGPRPIDLNNASAEELEASGILTSYQIYQLLNYRDKYGPLYSIYELSALPGFHSSYILKNESFIKTGTSRIPESSKAGQHMILINLERAYSNSQTDSSHLGPPLKSILRIRSHPRSFLSLALSYEKDGGEPFLYQKRPQFFSAYLSYEGKQFLKQLVIGNYRLDQGAGLVNGSGFIHRAGSFRITRQAFSRIKPYASITESMYEQGMACRMGTGKFQFMLWASYHNFSLSKSAITEYAGTNQWLDFQRVSGLYRTESEVGARDLAYRIHSGIQVLFVRKGLSIGVLTGSEWTGPNKKALELIDENPG